MSPDNESLAERVAAELVQLVAPGATCLLAVSGGPDSLALLDLLHLSAARHGCTLVVGHVDHGIDADSGRIADQVAAAAGARDLSFHLRSLSLGAGCSETRARVARRAALVGLAFEAKASAIVLAHHADDQAETVLLRLLRGSGPAGLAGMAARNGSWIRPLLGVRRADLVAHLANRGLVPWTDPANSDPRHLRSWLRTEIMPRLAERLPDVTERLRRTGSQAAEARRAWGQVPELLAGLDVRATQRGISVAAPLLQGYRSPLRHAVLAALGRRIGVLLGARRLAALDRLLDGQSGGVIALDGNHRAELAFGRLTFTEVDVVPDPVPVVANRTLRLGCVELKVGNGRAGPLSRDGWSTALVPGKYVARTWRAGDRVRPLGGTGSRPVAVLLREARISPMQRAVWPVVTTEDDATIVWVPGICRADAAVPAPDDEAWRVECAFS